jgi:hypothetical protein
MGLIKNIAIKTITKRWTTKVYALIEESIVNSPQKDQLEILKEIITVTNLCGTNLPIDSMNFQELLSVYIITAVRSELAYDPTMGNDKDIELIVKTLRKKFNSLVKSKSLFGIFKRREMVRQMAKGKD